MKKYRAVIASILVATGAAWAAQKPNVVLIMTDDLNDYIGAYGHPMVKTPNIDRLAKEGMVFENAYCQFPLCGPSRNSMMSGLYPDQTHLYTLTHLLRQTHPDAVTMSQYFQQHGYVSARVGKIYHYMNPNDVGTNGHDDPASWDERINPKGVDKDIEAKGLIKSVSSKPGYGGRLSWYADPANRDEAHTDGMVATESINLMKKYADKDQPFFLGVGFYRPHTPYVAPKKYFDLYDINTITVPTVPEGYFATLPGPAVQSLTRGTAVAQLSDELAKKSILAYWAAISFVDAQIGRVLDAIDEMGLRENTVILFSSDHGYHMGEHKHYQKITLFEESARVPLVISAPSMKNRGSRTDSLVEMVDFYPTLAELAGLPAPGKIAGVSMVPVLNNPDTKVRDSALTQIKNGHSIRTERYRYTRWQEGGEKMIELYDWQNDPSEMVNLARNPENRDLIKKMEALWQQRVKAASIPPEGVEIKSRSKKGSKNKKG